MDSSPGPKAETFWHSDQDIDSEIEEHKAKVSWARRYVAMASFDYKRMNDQ